MFLNIYSFVISVILFYINMFMLSELVLGWFNGFAFMQRKCIYALSMQDYLSF